MKINVREIATRLFIEYMRDDCERNKNCSGLEYRTNKAINDAEYFLHILDKKFPEESNDEFLKMFGLFQNES